MSTVKKTYLYQLTLAEMLQGAGAALVGGTIPMAATIAMDTAKSAALGAFKAMPQNPTAALEAAKNAKELTPAEVCGRRGEDA